MHVLRHIDRDRFRFDFLTHTEEPAAYDDEARALGARIIPCLHPSQPLAYGRRFKRILRVHGSYDVVHSHVHHFSGYTLRLAAQAGVPMRIAHSHSDTAAHESAARPARRAYLAIMERWIQQYATAGLAASEQAAAALYGLNWKQDPRWRTLYCAIDLAPFRAPVDSAACRAELGIPADALVIGHVGRFVPVKTHAFLIEIAAEIMQREPRARFLLVGDGPLRPDIERSVQAAGLGKHVVFAGLRGDVPRLMCGAMDVFLMPSLYEGLPVVGLEAQAAGLPLVLSDTITSEADVIPALVRHISLTQPASVWADAVLAPRPAVAQADALAQIEGSVFTIEHSVRELEAVYRVMS
jgi:glycosyltransferase involved in cell wall biosynthesis